MCGIAGFCNFDADFLQDTESWTQVLAGMRTAIAHRGHDQTGEYLQRHVGLSHTRLSIRDLLGGAQPMLRQRGNREYGISLQRRNLQCGGAETGSAQPWLPL